MNLVDSPCPIARSVACLGDSWSILILRDASFGLTRFDQFRTSLGIAPSILTRRLAALTEEGLLEKRRYSERPPRDEYLLTEAGRDFIPVLVMIVGTLGLLATPITMTLTRLQESDADRFSLEKAHEPDGLSKALVKTIEYRASSPGPVEEAIFYDHPSVERRVHRAMVWKAEHPDLVGK